MELIEVRKTELVFDNRANVDHHGLMEITDEDHEYADMICQEFKLVRSEMWGNNDTGEIGITNKSFVQGRN